jgi:hypothetical protein
VIFSTTAVSPSWLVSPASVLATGRLRRLQLIYTPAEGTSTVEFADTWGYFGLLTSFGESLLMFDATTAIPYMGEQAARATAKGLTEVAAGQAMYTGWNAGWVASSANNAASTATALGRYNFWATGASVGLTVYSITARIICSARSN